MHLYSFIRLERLRQYDYLFPLRSPSKISQQYIRSITSHSPQFSQSYLLVAGTVLGNEGVDAVDVELVSLGRAVVLDLLPGAVELLLL
jgi:hypothetical protein